MTCQRAVISASCSNAVDISCIDASLTSARTPNLHPVHDMQEEQIANVSSLVYNNEDVVQLARLDVIEHLIPDGAEVLGAWQPYWTSY